jgi:TolA-binding protein
MPLVKFQASDEQALQLMRHTRQQVSSKAFFRAALEAPQLAQELRDAHEEIARLRRIVDRQAQVLESARSAAMHLVEAAGQGDMFMSGEKVPAEPPARRRPTPAGDPTGTETGVSPQAGETMDHFLARLNRSGRS